MTRSGGTGRFSPCPSAALRALLDWASRYDVGELTDLSVITPSLEEAYLHLVEHNGDSRR